MSIWGGFHFFIFSILASNQNIQKSSFIFLQDKNIKIYSPIFKYLYLLALKKTNPWQLTYWAVINVWRLTPLDMSYRTTSRSSAGSSYNQKKSTNEKNQKILRDLVKDPANKVCADCKTSGHPRWTSWSLGIFICIR